MMPRSRPADVDYPQLLAVDDEVWVASYGDGVVEILE